MAQLDYPRLTAVSQTTIHFLLTELVLQSPKYRVNGKSSRRAHYKLLLAFNTFAREPVPRANLSNEVQHRGPLPAKTSRVSFEGARSGGSRPRRML